MIKESVLYPDYRILLTNKKEQTIDTLQFGLIFRELC